MKPTVLITGVAGMIGYHVSTRLVRQGFEVIGMDDLSGGSRAGLEHFRTLYECSCLETARVRRIMDYHRPRVIIHCAAMAAENLSHNCRVFTYRNNLVGEAVMRNAAVNFGVQCMISMSSIAVMGHQAPPYTEKDAPHPADPYGISKYAGEMDARTAKEHFGLNYVIFRPHNVIGTRQNMADRYRNVAAIFVRAIMERKPLPIFGDGLQTRAFSPVSYVADIIAASVSRPHTWNEIYNVGSDAPMTILELKALFEDILQDQLPAEHLDARKEAVHAHMNHDKVRCAFSDIEETETVKKVLTDMISEAQDAPFVPEYQKGPEIEISANLPPSWIQASK